MTTQKLKRLGNVERNEDIQKIKWEGLTQTKSNSQERIKKIEDKNYLKRQWQNFLEWIKDNEPTNTRNTM